MNTAVETLGSDIRADFVERSREAEALLVEIAREGRTDFLTSERAFFARTMGWSPDDAKKELRRVNTIQRLGAIAGDQKAREAALHECQVSTDLLAKEEPKILEQIAKLESKLAGLRRDASTAQKRVEAQAEAVQQLRGYCPEDIKESVRLAVKTVEAGIGQQLRDAKTRHHELRCILNEGGLYPSTEKHLESLQRILRAAVSETVENKMIRRSYSPAWPALKAECENELRELSARLPELQSQYDQQIQRAELPLDHYAG
ncbi:MAG: hypothetical protein KDA89_15030 [Planctomycetaceae bacterium]|nr:hypothetical protein [Planctomycetaceae bacterium]